MLYVQAFKKIVLNVPIVRSLKYYLYLIFKSKLVPYIDICIYIGNSVNFVVYPVLIIVDLKIIKCF